MEHKQVVALWDSVMDEGGIGEPFADASPKLQAQIGAFAAVLESELTRPIPMRITCPECRELHIDEGRFATNPHHTHSCQGCGLTWRPAVVHTVGVRFLPGFKNEAKDGGGG